MPNNPNPAIPSDVSPILRQHIKSSERLMLRAYFDPVGVPTAGYGRTKGITAAMARAQTPNTEEQANQWLEEDLDDAEAVVHANVKVPLNQNQYDALVDFVFNVGGTNFKKSTLLRVLNAGNYEQAKVEFMRWNKARDRRTGKMVALKGLTIRRAWEAKLFGTPDTSLAPTIQPPTSDMTVSPEEPKTIAKTSLWELIVDLFNIVFTVLRGFKK